MIRLILIAALLLRIVGTIPGHNPYHPDEPMSYGSAFEMLSHDDLNPRRFDYPAGVPLLHYGIYRTFIIPPLLLVKYWNSPGNIFEAAISGGAFFAQRSNELFGTGQVLLLFVSRIVTAILGVTTVYLVYVVGKKLFDKTVGLSAAFFLAVNYRHVLSSHLALSDVPNALFSLLAFLATLFLLDKQTRARYVLTGILIGLAVSMKYQVFTLLPLLFVQIILAIRKKSVMALFNRNSILALALIPIVFILLNPYVFGDLAKNLEQITTVSRRYGAGVNRFNFYPIYYLYNWGISTLPFFAMLTGFLIAFVRKPLETLILTSFIGPFLYIFLFYMTGGTYVRNFTTVLPFVSIFGGVTIAQLISIFGRFINRQSATIFGFILLFSINIKPIGDSLTLAVSYATSWNREVLIKWFNKNIPANTRIINANISLPTTLEKSAIIDQWEHKEVNSISELVDKGYDFAALNVSWYQIYLFWFDMPWQVLKTANGIPVPQLQNSYYGLALEEMKRYAVKEIYKPWQAPDDNYLILKIPRLPQSLPSKSEKLALNKSFEIEEGKLYRVDALVKNHGAIESNRRDAFLRAAFYDQGGKPIFTAVSGRAFGEPGRHPLTVYAVAPPDSKSLVVRLERSRPQDGQEYEVSSGTISLYSQLFVDKYPGISLIRPTIPKDVVYPIAIY